MNELLLTPEEPSQLKNNEWLSGRWFYDPCELMQAQPNKVLKWLNEPCLEHDNWKILDDGTREPLLHRECPECWQES